MSHRSFLSRDIVAIPALADYPTSATQGFTGGARTLTLLDEMHSLLADGVH